MIVTTVCVFFFFGVCVGRHTVYSFMAQFFLVKLELITGLPPCSPKIVYVVSSVAEMFKICLELFCCRKVPTKLLTGEKKN